MPSKRNKESKCSHWHIVASILWIVFLGILYKWLAQLSHLHPQELPERHTSAPLSLTPSLLQSHLREMLKHRSQNGTIVLVGFTEGYKDMLLNMICRWKELGVENYAIVAFDVPSIVFCWERSLPCFYPFPESSESVPAMSQSPSPSMEPTVVYEWNSDGFKRITKLKSQQVLRLLKQGYNVLWTDLDVIWKANPMPDLLRLLAKDDHDVLIQSDATAQKEASTLINSGFYYVKQSEHTVRAFQEIVNGAAAAHDESEQPSFHRVLCRRRLDSDNCINDDLSVRTHVLNRWIYAHGAIPVLSNSLIDDDNGVVMMHCNYRVGFEVKKKCFRIGNMWLLEGEEKTCRAHNI